MENTFTTPRSSEDQHWTCKKVCGCLKQTTMTVFNEELAIYRRNCGSISE